jgi:hypothetical protein
MVAPLLFEYSLSQRRISDGRERYTGHWRSLSIIARSHPLAAHIHTCAGITPLDLNLGLIGITPARPARRPMARE